MLDKWRARIGWIHPRVNSDIEIYDFYQAAPKDVVLVITHLEVVDSARKEEVEASLQHLERAVERLSLAKVDFIMKNGAPVHLHHGNEGHRRILERLRAASKVPVTTAKTILVISSWRKESDHLSNNLRNFLDSEGLEIAALEGIGGRQLSSYEKLALTPEQIYSNALEACQKHPTVDAVYIQSGTMATMGIIDELEQQIGKPVVSSNSANIWGSFKPLNIKVGSGFGRLLASI
jgi:maleate isomerase